MANRKITYEVGFTGDTSQLQAALKQAVASLQELGANPQNLQKGLEGAAHAALELNNHLRNAYNADTGKLDLTRFRQELEKSGKELKDYAAELRALGPAGEQAFMNVAQAIGAAELPLKRSHALMEKLWVTMKNTARWRLTTGVLNSFIGGLQQAFGYAKSLDSSLNNIRIVTSKSADEMARFAKEANQAAKNLSTTTTTYTDASLIYYQQGLSDEEVKNRTDTTIKMANVTGQSAETISSEMTAVWNNFKEGNRTLESYADTMVALGAATASSSKEIAEGLEKFAPIANSVGLSFDYASAALATLVATTRESASVAGNALKTLFSRLEGLKLGETLEDGTDLNKYSQALYTVGINIKDTNGELKDMDLILNELGNRWKDLARDEQMALAQTVGGVRQYTQLVALMDNWQTFQENLVTAKTAEGSLDKQAQIYAESWMAARDRVKAATEEVYDSLINPKVFIDLDKMSQAVLKPLASILNGVGGLTGLLPIVAAWMTKVYSSQIASTMRDMAVNIGLMMGKEQERVRILQAEAAEIANKLSLTSDDSISEGYRNQILSDRVKIQGEINQVADKLTQEQEKEIKNELYILDLLEKEQVRRAQLAEEANVKREGTFEGLLNGVTLPKNSGDPLWKNTNGIRKQLTDTLNQITQIYIKGGQQAGTAYITNFENVLKNKTSLTIPQKIDAILKTTDLEYQKIQQTLAHLQPLDEILRLNDATPEQIKQVAMAVGEMGEKDELTAEKTEELRAKIANLEERARALLNVYRAIGVQSGPLTSYIQATHQSAVESEKASAVDETRIEVLDRLRELLKQAGIASQDWADNLVQVSHSLSTAAMGMRSVTTIFNILQDSSLSAGEKVTQSLTSLTMLIPVVAQGISNLGQVIAGATLTVKTAMPIIAAISVVIFAVVKAIDFFTTSQKEALEAIEKSTEEYKKVKQELDDLQDKLTTTQDRIKELQELAKSGSISIVEQDELNNLDLENIKLQKQFELKEKLAEIQFNEWKNDTGQNIETAYQFSNLKQPTKEALYVDDELQKLSKQLLDNSVYNVTDLANFLSKYNPNLSLSKDDFISVVESEARLLTENERIVLDATYRRIEELRDKFYNEWLSENDEIYQSIEDKYDEYLNAIDRGWASSADTVFKTLFYKLQTMRKKYFGEDYNNIFVSPAASSLDDRVIQNILNSNLSNLHAKELNDLFDANSNQILQQAGITQFDLMSYVKEIQKNAIENISLTEAEDILDVNKLSFKALELIAKFKLDETDTETEPIIQLLNFLQKNSGIIPVSLQVEAIEDARTEALTTLASGELLGEELIAKLQEAYAGIRDMSNFANLSVKDQLDFLSNEGKVVQEQIDALEKEREVLDTKKDKEDLGINPQAIQQKINQIDKELEELRDKYTKDPWKIELETDNTLAAQLNNAKKAFSLIGDDLIVTSTELEELAKRYPETLTDATYDASENVIKINQETYDYLKGQIEGTLDTERDVAAQRLLLSTQLGESLIDINEFIETNKRDDNLKTITQALLGNEKLTQSVQDMALQTLTAVVKAEADKRKANMDTMAAEVAGAATVTDNINENTKINVENQAEAAQEILRIFDDLFRQIANGYEDALSGNYTGILRDFTSGYKGKSGASYTDTYNKNLNDVLNSPAYKKEEKAYNFSNALYQALVKYGDTKNPEDWQAVQNIFHSKDFDGPLSEIVRPESWMPTDILDVANYGTHLFGQEITDLIDNGIPINFDDEASINDFLHKLSQAISDDENFGASWRDALQERYAALARLLEGEEASDKTKGSGSGKADYVKLDNADLEKHEDLLEDIEDRYHEITREIERQNRVLSQLETQAERTYGLDRLELYEKELKELEGLYEKQRAKQGRAEKYLADVDKPRLQTAFQATETKEGVMNALGRHGFSGFSNIAVDLSKPGQEIKNFEALEDNIRQDTNNFLTSYHAFMVEYDNFLQKYNAATDEEKNTMQEKALQMQQEYELVTAQFELVEASQEERLAAIKQYEETLDTINTLAHEMEETLRKEEDTKLKEVTHRMTVILDVRDARKQIRDFSKEIAESFGDALTHGLQTAILGQDQAKDEIAMYKEYVQEYNDLKNLLDNATEYTDTEAIVAELKELEGNIIESGQRLLEWSEQVENMFVEALDAAADRFSYFTEQLEHNDAILSTIKELYALQGQTYKTQQGFERLQRVSQERLETQIAQAKLQRKWFEEADSRLQTAQAELDKLIAEKGAKAEQDIRYDTLKKNRDALLEQQRQAQSAMLNAAKEAMETTRQMYLDEIEKMSYDLEQRITNGVGYDLLQEKYDHFIEEQDRYFDPIEEALETASWYAKLQEDINKTSNKTHQDKLKSLQKEIDLRRENNTLSQYDLDLLEAKYKTLQATMDLEDARNNKNQLRLVRDSQGNWNYQFTANPDDIKGKEQELIKARQNEYDITKKRNEDLTSEYVRTMDEWGKKTKQVSDDIINHILTDEEGKAQLAEIERYYSAKAEYLRKELDIAQVDMNNAAVTSAVLAANLSDAVYQTSNTAVQAIVDNFKTKYSQDILTQATTSFGDLQLLLGEHTTDFENTSKDIQGVIASIVSAPNQDGEGRTFEGLVGKIKEYDPVIADALKTWVSTFDTELGAEQGIQKIVNTLTNDFSGSIKEMTDGITTKFLPAVQDYMPKAGEIFEEYEGKVGDVADETGTSLDSLDEATQKVSESTDEAADKGYDAADALWKQVTAVKAAQQGYLDFAQTVWDTVYALQTLAAAQVVPTIEYASGVNTFNDSKIPPQVLEYKGDLSQQMAQAEYNYRLTGNSQYRTDYEGFKASREGAEEILGADVVGATEDVDTTIRTASDAILKLMAEGLEAINKTLQKENAEEAYKVTGAATYYADEEHASFATGGYTGDFDNGRLAILHEKELVLNAEDTENILEAVSLVRSMDSIFSGIAEQLDGEGLAAMALLGSRIGGIGAPAPASTDLEQHVTIEHVSFPGVTSSREIEEAFESLVNDAAQWARRRKS